MAQAATAQDLSQEQVQAPEQAGEVGKSPERAELGKALESGSKENVVSIFKKNSEAAKEAIARLDVASDDVNPAFLTEAPSAKAIVENVKAANDTALKKTEQAESEAIQQVSAAMGEPTVAVVEAPVPTPVAVVEKPVEIAAPVMAAEKPLEASVLRNEMAEQQKTEAEASMKEDLEALQTFAGEHGLHLDADLNAPETELQNLTHTERTYVAVLQAKYRAGHASEAHAQALMDVAAESDPIKKKELSKKAFELSQTSTVMEKAATVLNDEYMALPEIAALAAAAAAVTHGNETGGSIEGQHFDTPSAGGGSGPQNPEGPKGPQGPDLTLIKGGGSKGSTGGGGVLYSDQVYGGPPGLVKVEPVKKPEPLPKKEHKPEHINWFRRWVIKEGTTVGSLFGLGGGGGGGGGGKSSSKDHH